MSRTNETRHIKWHETCKCICRLDAIVCNNKQRWNDNKCWCECKELINKGVCDEGFAWNPGIRECENCKCRKRLVDKLIDESTETIDEEVKILDKNKDKCSSWILKIVLFSIFFTINVGICAYFVYYKYMNRNKENDYLHQI